MTFAKLSALGLPCLALALASCASANPSDPAGEPVGTAASAIDALSPVASFGPNPGNLLMFAYVPQGMPQDAPVVFALHGCTETASDMTSAGWNQIADQYKFYVVYPQQQSANNTEQCFDFFGATSGSLADITRDQGEAASIKSMVDYMKSTYSVDSSRVFATGFSAGAAYAVALLALYPDVFAAGASFEGIPFGCANSLASAYTCMYTATNDSPSQWATLVKNGYPGYAGKYPRISIWEGSSDTTVVPANQAELVAQWTAVTGASASPTSMTSGNNYQHALYADGSGAVLVETYTITGMTHGVAVDSSSNCGASGQYFFDEGVCAADQVAKFFGIEGAQSQPPPAKQDAGSGAMGQGQGGSSQGAGGSGMSNLGMGSGSAADGGTGGAGSGDAPDAGAGTPPMPGCSAAPNRATTGAGTSLLGLAFAVIAVALRRRSRASRSRGARVILGAAALLSLAAILGTPRSARADEGDAPPPDTTTSSSKHAKPAILGPQGAFFTGASVNTTPALLFGVFPVDHLATTVGLGMSYNANGSPTSPLTGIKGAPNNRFGADFMLDVLYFIYDKAPFAMGPELNFIGSLSPNYPLTMTVLTPMWALRYAPWKAPIAIGTGLGAGVAFERGAKPVVNLATQGLDIVYAF